MIFLFISFAFSNNYCIEKTEGRCQSLCSNLPEKIDETFSYIPNDNNLNTNDSEKHNFYIADDVDYQNSSHHLIFCDKSIHLIYKNPISSIKLNDHIYINSTIKLKDVPVLFQIKNDIKIVIYANENKFFDSIILESYSYNNLIVPVFFSENFPENLILISSNSYYMTILDINDNVKKLFNTTEKFYDNNNDYKYYCISDKEKESEKCPGYSSYNLEYIESTSNIGRYYRRYTYVIIDTAIPQILITYLDDLNYNYYVIGLENSDVTFYPNNQPNNGDFYVIMNPDSIEMPSLHFEGKGKFTLATSANISILPKTTVNNNNFILKAKHPFVLNESCIHAIDETLNINFNKKIQIADYCAFVGPKKLSGLFEQGKYFSEEDFFNSNITVSTLKEYQYDYVTYYFQKGEHVIPTTWKKPCRFQGIEPDETTFVFSDVHHYDGQTIDHFIDVNYKPSNSLNKIIIKPSAYLYLNSFGSKYSEKFNEKYTIQVDKDFFMYGPNGYDGYDDDEISKDQCKIVGNGKIKFFDSEYMNKVKKYCEIDPNINLELTDRPYHYLNFCIGQESIDKCKNEINDIDSTSNNEWIWIRNIQTYQKYYSDYSYRIAKIYLTDDQIFYDYNNNYINIIVTSKANLLIQYPRQIYLYKNKIFNIEAQSQMAKVTLFFNSSENYHSDSIYYNKQYFQLNIIETPTDIDFQVYFHFPYIKLYMKYMQKFDEKSIKLTGKGAIYFREQHRKQISIFKESENIKFVLNSDSNYNQICFYDEFVESDQLYDFVLADTIEKFVDLQNRYVNAYIFKDFTLTFNSSDSIPINFNFINVSSVTIDLPNNCYFLFQQNYFQIIIDRSTYHNLNYNSNLTKFTFDIKDNINLDYVAISPETPKIHFTSSKNCVEVFPNPSLRLVNSSLNYIISVPNDFTIYSPVPSYIKGIFGSATIKHSTKWSYFYLSDKEKVLDEPFKLITHQNFENDENLNQKFVLMIDSNDQVSIPSNWKNIHNIYYQGEDSLDISSPTNLTYQIDGLVLDNLFRIVAGNIRIFVPSSFTINVEYKYTYYYKERYMYDAILNCSRNSHTDLYITQKDYLYSIEIVKIYGNEYNNSLFINADDSYELDYFKSILYLDSLINVKYVLDYKFICYDKYYYDSVCTGKYFFASGIETLLNAVKDFSGLPILIAQDLTIPFSTGDHFILQPYDENVKICVPYSPHLMIIKDKNNIQFNYLDSTLIEIMNNSEIDVNLNRPLKMNVESGTSSLINFNLGSDVLLSTDKPINEDLNIQVNDNSYNLYSENIDRFGNNFKDKLLKYHKICAYDTEDAKAFCSFPDKETIENVFNNDFIYNEIELALSSQPHKIILPSIEKQVNVFILTSESILTIQKVTNLEIESDMITINDYWRFQGDLPRLCIELEVESTLSNIGRMVTPITLKFTNANSIIDLYDFEKQNERLITLVKYGNDINNVKILGTNEIFNNLINSIIEKTDISFSLDDRQKYLCICNDLDSYTKCQSEIVGIFKKAETIKKDPGTSVIIRIFSNIEIPVNIFRKEHEVYLDYQYQVNLTKIKSVEQNIEKGLKIEKLTFENGTNLLLKPRENKLKIYMREYEPGPYFTIDVDKYLNLEASNIQNEHSAASRIHVTGKGELYVPDYPIERIRPGEKIKLIKGVYAICGSTNGDFICSYESEYRQLDSYTNFENYFDEHSKIIVFLNSFSKSLDVRMNQLNNQQIQFDRTSYSKSLLDDQDPVKLRFLSTSELIGKSDSEIGLSNSVGGVSLNSSDSDLFVVGFDDVLLIKQEDTISKNLNGIVIQPTSDKVTINIDESVDIEKQKLIIKTGDEKPVSITIQSNMQNLDQNKLNGMFDFDPKKVVIDEIVDRDGPKSDDKKKKFSPKAIIAIAVVAAIVVVVAIIGIIFAVRERHKERVENDLDDVPN